jgi:hypothetical protein
LLAYEESVAICTVWRSWSNWTTKTNATGSPTEYWSLLGDVLAEQGYQEDLVGTREKK